MRDGELLLHKYLRVCCFIHKLADDTAEKVYYLYIVTGRCHSIIPGDSRTVEGMSMEVSFN